MQTEAAERLLQEMRAGGVKPDNGSYRGVVKSLAKSGDYEKCLKLLEVTLGCTGVSQSSPHRRKTTSDRSYEPPSPFNFQRMAQEDGLEPDLLLFTDAMEVFAKSQNPGATLRVLDQMKGAKQPDLRLYLAPLIDADEAAEASVHGAFVREVEALATLRLLD